MSELAATPEAVTRKVEVDELQLLRDQMRNLDTKFDQFIDRMVKTIDPTSNIQDTFRQHASAIGEIRGLYTGLIKTVDVVTNIVNRTTDSVTEVSKALAALNSYVQDVDSRGQQLFKLAEKIDRDVQDSRTELKEAMEFIRREREAEERQRAMMTRAQRWGLRLFWAFIAATSGTGVFAIILELLRLFLK